MAFELPGKFPTTVDIALLDDKNARQIERWMKQLDGDGAKDGNPFAKWMKQTGRIYASNMRRRYIRLSRGGSWRGRTWKPLSRATLRQRAKKTSGAFERNGQFFVNRARRDASGRFVGGSQPSIMKAATLIDIGNLRDALPERGATLPAGSTIADIKRGVRFQFTSIAHRTDIADGPTLGELAVIHHFGDPKKNLPPRPILDAPDDNGIRQMVAAAHRIAKDMLNQLE